MATSWLNPDGLYVKFNSDQGVVGKWGAYANPANGNQTIVEGLLDLTTLATGSTIISDNVSIPKYAWIDEVQVEVKVAGTGTGAVLNVGLIADDRSTSYDSDGFVQAMVLTSLDELGETNTFNKNAVAGGGGTLVGTATTQNGLIVADYDTAAFTAGSVWIRIKYHMNQNR